MQLILAAGVETFGFVGYNMCVMKIAIDLDKTIVDNKSFVFRVANLAVCRQKLTTDFHYTQIFDNEKRMRPPKFLPIFNADRYFVVEDCAKYIKKWFDEGAKICVLSSRPNWRLMRSLTNSVLEKVGIIDLVDVFIACNNKAKFCQHHGIDILIDNSMAICENADTLGLRSIHYCKALSPCKSRGLVDVVSGWQEIDEIVSDLIKQNSEESEK